MAFRFNYTTSPGVNYQFFEYVPASGTLNYHDSTGAIAGSLPITSANLSTVFPGPGAGCTAGWDGCAASSVNTMYVNFTEATFVDLIQNGSASLDLTLEMDIKVKAMTDSGAPPPGAYILTPLECQFWGGPGSGAASCDPYHCTMEVLNVQTVYECVITPADFANESLGMPYPTGLCDRYFYLLTKVVGGVPGNNEFKNEFRTVNNWNNPNHPISVTLPPGVYLNSAHFGVLLRTPFYNVNVTHFGSVVSGETVTFDSYNIPAGTANNPFPVLDRDGYSTDMILWGTLTRHCPVTQADPVDSILNPATFFSFPFISQAYSDPNWGCIYFHLSTDDPAGDKRPFPPTNPDPIISLTADVTPFHITGVPSIISGLEYSLIAYNGAAIDHAYLKITVPPAVPGPTLNINAVCVGPSVPAATLTHGTTLATSSTATFTANAASLPAAGFSVGDTVLIAGATPAQYNGCVVITAVSGNAFNYTMISDPQANATALSGPITAVRSAPLVNGYYQLGSIASGTQNPAHISLCVDLVGCQPGDPPIPIQFDYGYACDGYPGDPSSIPGDPAVSPCVNQTYQMAAYVEKSGLEMWVNQLQPADPLYPLLACPCENFFQVRLTSTEAAAVLGPGLTIESPPGMQISSAAFLTTSYDATGQPIQTAKIFAGCDHLHPPYDHVTFNTVLQTLPTTFATAVTDYTWDINADVYGGLGIPPGVAYVDLIIGVRGCVHYPVFKFHATGFNLCGGAIPVGPGFSDALVTLVTGPAPLPLATTPAGAGDMMLQCSDAAGLAAALAFVPSFADSCAPAPLTLNAPTDSTMANPQCPNGYTRVRTWTATDACGNTSLPYVQTITVVDTIAPVAMTVAGAGNVTVQCSDATGLAAALAFVPVFKDNCTLVPTLSVPTDMTTADPLCPNGYKRVRTWTATDGCGNTSLPYVQTITVVDTIAPMAATAVGAGNVTLQCDNAAGLATALTFVPVFTDNCTTAPLTLNGPTVSTTVDPLCPNGFKRVRTWTATDACGNTSLPYVQTITVVDTIPPVATTAAGAGDVTLQSGDAVGLATALAFVPVFSDNCTPTPTVSLITAITTVNPLCAGGYSEVRTWTATDACGNTSLPYVQTITVACPTNCCDGCKPADYVSYSVYIQAGAIYYLVNHLCHGSNTLDEVLNVPDGTMIYRWNTASQNYDSPYTYYSGYGWADNNLFLVNATLNPGEGFVLTSATSFNLIFTGCDPGTNCPLPCLPDQSGCVLAGRIGIGTAHWADLSSCPLLCGTQIKIWDVPSQTFTLYTYLNGYWDPQEPVLAIGTSAFVCYVDNPNCCTNFQNRVINGSFESTSPFIAAGQVNDSLDRLTGVPGWTSPPGNFLEVWANTFAGIPASDGLNQLEINAQSDNQTVFQVVSGLSTNCSAEFCFDYTGRFDPHGTTPNNNFTVSLSGGYTLSVPLNPATYATGGWLRFCTNFVPLASSLTIQFHGQPHFSDGSPDYEGGAHIDHVSLIQCCCPPNATMQIMISGGNIVVTWIGADYHLQSATTLGTGAIWTDIPGASPITLPLPAAGAQFFRLICY